MGLFSNNKHNEELEELRAELAKKEQELETYRDYIKRMMGGITSNVVNVNENALNVSSVMQELAASMEEVSSSIITVNQSATDANNEISEIVQNLEDLNNYATEMEENAGALVESAKWNKQDTLEKVTPIGVSLKKAVEENFTSIEGGLILSSLLKLGYKDTNNSFKEMSGVNGIFTKPTSIAAWYGGDMVDMFDYYNYTTGDFENLPLSYAKGLDRMDGSGYRANGSLWWGTDGVVHANPLSFFVGEETVGLLLSAFLDFNILHMIIFFPLLLYVNKTFNLLPLANSNSCSSPLLLIRSIYNPLAPCGIIIFSKVSYEPNSSFNDDFTRPTPMYPLSSITAPQLI